MGIKGKTTFELTDVNTGKVEVIEDNNMLTNGLQDFLTPCGYWGCDVLSNDVVRKNQLWMHLLSGLLLFDTALEEDVTNTFMPAGVKMVGNGSKDVANSGVVTELGSYNTTESGVQADGNIKLVYDFSTQQANGSIACACLTSRIGGYMGMGNSTYNRYDGYNTDSGGKKDNKFETFISDDLCYYGISGNDNDLRHLLYPVYNESAIYFTNPYNINYSSAYASQHWSVTKKIQVLKVRAGFSKTNIKQSDTLKQIESTFEVAIPEEILTYMGTSTNYVFALGDGLDRNVYVIFYKNSNEKLRNGTYCYIMKIDKDFNATAYKVTNNTGVDLYLPLGSLQYAVFNGNYFWACGTDSKLYGIKYSDSTQIIEGGKTGLHYIYSIAPNILLLNGDNANGYNASYFAPQIYDVTNRTYKYVNGHTLIDSRNSLVPFPDKKGLYIYNIYNTGLKLLKDPRYLATINNLKEPVVKTSSKTMKVTYTLTFEE